MRAMLRSQVLVYALVLVAASAAAGPPDWNAVAQLEERGEYEAAMSLCLAASEGGSSQRAAVRAGILAYKLGVPSEAVDRLEQATEEDPLNVCAAEGLFYLARACTEVDCPDTVVECVRRLRLYHPGSAWTTRAERLAAGTATLNGEQGTLLGGDSPEDIADAMYHEALRLARADLHQDSLNVLNYLVQSFPNTRTALAARLSVANLSAKLGDRSAAIAAAESLLTDTTDAAPSARLVCLARHRLARVYRLEHRKYDAVVQFDLLANTSTVPSEVVEARLGAAGAFMEYLMAETHAARSGRSAPDPKMWEQLRQRCGVILQATDAQESPRARATLIIAESYHWEGRFDDALVAALGFLAQYDDKTYSQEAATAHMVAGESLQVRKDLGAALEHYKWITSRFGVTEVWSRLTLTQRAYFRIVDVLTLTDAPRSEIDAYAAIVFENWPDSRHAARVRALLAAREKTVEAQP